MQLFEISLIINFGLIILCLSLVYPKAIDWYKKLTRRRENLSKLERANLTKTIRTEVRRYLKEIQSND
jgi:hypothetical protein